MKTSAAQRTSVVSRPPSGSTQKFPAGCGDQREHIEVGEHVGGGLHFDGGRRAARVRVTDRQGASYERLRLTRKGDPEDPLSDRELRDKFDEFVPPVVGTPRVEAIAAVLWKLPALPRMSALDWG